MRYFVMAYWGSTVGDHRYQAILCNNEKVMRYVLAHYFYLHWYRFFPTMMRSKLGTLRTEYSDITVEFSDPVGTERGTAKPDDTPITDCTHVKITYAPPVCRALTSGGTKLTTKTCKNFEHELHIICRDGGFSETVANELLKFAEIKSFEMAVTADEQDYPGEITYQDGTTVDYDLLGKSYVVAYDSKLHLTLRSATRPEYTAVYTDLVNTEAANTLTVDDTNEDLWR